MMTERCFDVDFVINSIKNSMDIVERSGSLISSTSQELYLLGLKHALNIVEIALDGSAQIVRCRECTHWERGVCHNPHHRYLMTEMDHFCGYGEREAHNEN